MATPEQPETYSLRSAEAQRAGFDAMPSAAQGTPGQITPAAPPQRLEQPSRLQTLPLADVASSYGTASMHHPHSRK